MEKQFNIGNFYHYNEDGKDTEDERYIVACDVSDKADNFSLSVFDNEQGEIIEVCSDMRTREEVNKFLNSLQWTRTTRDELERKFCEFFDMEEMTLEDATDDDFKDVDHSFVITTATLPTPTENFVDMEIYYLPMRMDGWFLITGSEILMYNE